MATTYKEFTVDAGIASVWDALRDFNAVHQRLAPGFVVDCQPGDGSRTRFSGSPTCCPMRWRTMSAR